jgi:hypothetical protein
MNKASARSLIAALNAAYPRESIEPETFAIYEQAFMRLQLRAAKQAVWAVIETCPRFPSIAEIRSAYGLEVRAVRRDEADERGLPEPSAGPPPKETVEKLRELGVLSDQAYANLLAASAGAEDPEEHAARVAAVIHGKAGTA